MNKKQNRWTDEEIDFLKNKYHLMSVDELTKVISKTKSSIFTKASELNLKNKYILDQTITIETVKEYLSQYEVEAISKEYINTTSKLKLRCRCGVIFERTFSKCKTNSSLCVRCTKEERLNYTGLLLNDIDFLVNNGNQVLFHEHYHGEVTKFKIVCSCGSEDVKTMKALKKHPCCETCAKRNNGKRNLTNEEVFEIISLKSDCILLSNDYVDRNSTLKLKCPCGEVFYTYLERFLNENKRQCNDCGIARRCGDGNPNWKGGITPESQKLRHSKEYVNWRNDVFERDNYTCQCCGDNIGGNLQAHHINNFSDNEDIRFALYNGITMCDKCHDFRNIGSFHNIYGTNDNNILELQDYFDDIREILNMPLVNIEEIIYKDYIIKEVV